MSVYKSRIQSGLEYRNTLEIKIIRTWGSVFAMAGAQFSHPEKGNLSYQFQHLNFKGNYEGSRHVFSTKLNLERFQFTRNLVS